MNTGKEFNNLTEEEMCDLMCGDPELDDDDECDDHLSDEYGPDDTGEHLENMLTTIYYAIQEYLEYRGYSV